MSSSNGEMPPEYHYFLLNKPYNMVSQFVSSHRVRLLGSLTYCFPPDTHAIGRLDYQTEGLLLLTDDKRVTRLLFSSKIPHKRTYWVQVSGIVTEDNLTNIRNGLSLFGRGAKYYTSQPCEAEIMTPPADLFEAPRKLHPSVVFTWLCLTLTEGKYHQVRKMTAAVGHRCLRLIRASIEDLSLDSLAPGEVRAIKGEQFFAQLKITPPAR